MFTIAVYFALADDASPPSGKAAYVHAYSRLADIVARKGGRLVAVRGKGSYEGGNRFSGGWEWDGSSWRETVGPVEADVVFMKDRDFPRDASAKRVNGLAFEDLCSEKDKTYAAFPEVFPKTALAATADLLEAALGEIQGEVIVVKPADGACGRGVFVGKRPDLDRGSLPYPVLVQECIDMSQGVPGLCTGTHDVRIVFVGGQVALCTLRTPREGSLIANAAQGGSIAIVPPEKIPPEALALALHIDSRLQVYPERVYSVDMGLHRGTEWKVIELNAPPGLTPPDAGDVEKYYDLLADHLMAQG
jgi:glutathione synthase/RimK-type ligase-like ATP-grasp enzyme